MRYGRVRLAREYKKKTIPDIESFDNLQLKDLLKIEKGIRNYNKNAEKHEKERVEAERKNKEKMDYNERNNFYKNDDLPYTDIAYNSPLSNYRQRPIYKEIKQPSESSVFTFSGAKVRVNFTGLQSVQLGEIQKLIEVKQQQVAAKKKKDGEVLNQLKARASEKETDVRNQAKKYRNDFSQQKRIVSCCPYCGGGLNESDSHLDHIYPVSKGGLSVGQNLVFVCSSCNSQKKNYTLRDFIERKGLDGDTIHERLKTLKKDF